MSSSLQPYGPEPASLLCSWAFSRQEYWSGLPCPSPGDLPDLGLNLGLLHCRHILYCLSHQGSPCLPLLSSVQFSPVQSLSRVQLFATPWIGCVDHNKLWKIQKEMGIPDHLTCLLRNLYAGQEATVRTGHGTTTSSKQEKECVKAVYCHPAYLTYMQSTSWETLDWKKHKLESRLPGEISITSDMQMTPPLWQKVKRS